jgi:hypothetical protein
VAYVDSRWTQYSHPVFVILLFPLLALVSNAPTLVILVIETLLVLALISILVHPFLLPTTGAPILTDLVVPHSNDTQTIWHDTPLAATKHVPSLLNQALRSVSCSCWSCSKALPKLMYVL